MPDTDPNTPELPLTVDETVTPPEQPPMLDDEGEDETVNGEAAPDVPDRDLFA